MALASYRNHHFVIKMVIKCPSSIPAKCFAVSFLLVFISSQAFSFPYKDLNLKVRGTISEKYDDNIEFDDKGSEMSDFITELSAGFGVQYEGKIRTLGIEGQINKAIYSGHSDFNNLSGNYSLFINNELTEYDRISLINTYQLSFETGGVEDEFGRTRNRLKTSSVGFNFMYDKDVSKRIAVSLKYEYELNDLKGENPRGSYQNSISFAMNYAHSAASAFFLSYIFSERKFEDSGTNFPTHTISARIRQFISKQLSYDMTGGVDFRKEIVVNKEITAIGGYINAGITNDFKNNLVKISFVKSKRPNIFREELFDLWKTSASLSRSLMKRLETSLSGFYGQGVFEVSDLREKLLGVHVAFVYAFSDNIKGSLKFNHSKKKYNQADITGYTKNSVISGLTVGF